MHEFEDCFWSGTILLKHRGNSNGYCLTIFLFSWSVGSCNEARAHLDLSMSMKVECFTHRVKGWWDSYQYHSSPSFNTNKLKAS